MGYYGSLTAYLYWLTFGWFGLHHFYLGRDRHAFVWLWTCGGFVFGWLFELWRIPDYVRTANSELEKAIGPADNKPWLVVPVPSVRIKRIIGELLFSAYLSYTATSALPDEILSNLLWTSTISAFAVAIGVHTVANIGKEECSFTVCLFGAFVHFSVFFLGTMDNLFTSTVWSSLLSTIWATFRGRRMRTKVSPRRHLCKRLVILSLANIGMASLFLLAFYNHGDFELVDGSRLKAKVVIDRYFTSSYWQELKQVMHKLWCILLDNGLELFLREFSIVTTPQGEQNAYKVLGLSWNATEEQIRHKYQKLVKLYHPDKFVRSSPEERREAEIKFISIQQSYELLATKRSKSHRSTSH